MKTEKDQDHSVEEKIEALNKALEAVNKDPKKLAQGVAVDVRSEMETASKYLSGDSQVMLNKVNKFILHQYNKKLTKAQALELGASPESLEKEDEDSLYVRAVAPAVYLSVRVRKDRIEEGIKAISEEVNKFVEKGWVMGCLSPVSSIDLALLMFDHPTSVVFCFPHIKSEFYQDAQTSAYSQPEGGIGPAAHDLDADLAPGEFLADGSIIHFMDADGRKGAQATQESLIHNRIEEYLRYLPPGTKFVGYRRCAIMSLAIPIELKFYNELLQNVKRVDMDYVRQVALLTEGEGKNKKETLKQFNLFLGLRYFGIDPLTKEKNAELFRYKKD
jgi:hypothetical protein